MTNRLVFCIFCLIGLSGIFVSSPALAQQSASYTISWDQNSDPNVTEVLVYRSTSDVLNDYQVVATVDATESEYTDTGLEFGVRYYYRLKARSVTGALSRFSTAVTGLTIDENSPAWMDDLCRIVDERKVADGIHEIDWTSDSQSTGSVRYRKMGDSVYQESDDDLVPSLNHTTTLSGLDLDEIYLARAAAYDQSGNNLTISKDYVFDTNTGAGAFTLVSEIDTVAVDEGDRAQFGMRLSAEPNATIEVTVERIDGDLDISIVSGSVITFTRSNWDEYQQVTFAAAEDADAEPGQANYIAYVSAGQPSVYTLFSVVEIENDKATPAPGTTPSTSSVAIYPMPFRPGEGSLQFEELPAGGSVDIFDLRGRQVWKGDSAGQTSLTWNGDNLNSTTVMSGRYFVVVRNSRGDVVEKRAILVVR